MPSNKNNPEKDRKSRESSQKLTCENIGTLSIGEIRLLIISLGEWRQLINASNGDITNKNKLCSILRDAFDKWNRDADETEVPGPMSETQLNETRNLLMDELSIPKLKMYDAMIKDSDEKTDWRQTAKGSGNLLKLCNTTENIAEFRTKLLACKTGHFQKRLNAFHLFDANGHPRSKMSEICLAIKLIPDNLLRFKYAAVAASVLLTGLAGRRVYRAVQKPPLGV